MNQNPLIIQSDRTIVVEVYHPRYAEVRDRLAGFAELEKSPEHLHTYRITAISVWNAAALGVPEADICNFLSENSRYAMPNSLLREVREWYYRFGLLRLLASAEGLLLEGQDQAVLDLVLATKIVSDLVRRRISPTTALIAPEHRGVIKQALIRLGYPVQDLAGYLPGAPLAIGLRERLRSNAPFALRPYQAEAADIFHAQGRVEGGSGVVVLPCGAGKTVVGLAVMHRVGTYTLILTTNGVAVRQWRDEIIDKTDLERDQVGEYTGEAKDIRPITITTYQMLTYRRRKSDEFEHFGLFSSREWGLVVYDEVHLLPAPVFRVTADIQARRRLGLTATLVREDGKEDEVFCLIGPKRYDVPWKVLERQGFIASALCTEVRVPLPEAMRPLYMSCDARAKFRLASENPSKLSTVRHLIEHHKRDHVLVIGQYLDQLDQLAAVTGAPLITGKTPQPERRRLYEGFKNGSVPVLLVSKVGNFAIDLPDANVAIQVSGTFGSRQEEAQRLGRILRKKDDGGAAHFYSLVSAETREQEFAEKRQRFLTEQGYAYEIVDAERYRQAIEGPSASSA